MRQSDSIFINISNRFSNTTHSIEDIHTTNNLCFKKPPENSIIPYLCYTNPKTNAHNIKEFINATSSTFHFEAIDIRHCLVEASYQILHNPNKAVGLQTTIKAKKDMLVELTHNYAISDGLVHEVDGLF